MAPPADLIRALKDLETDDHRHGSRNLIDHLVGTHGLLEAWEQPTHVQRAGLFHSVYGTEFHTQAAIGLADRQRIQALIGEPAELLAYVFCVCSRRDFFSDLDSASVELPVRKTDEVVVVSHTQIVELIALEAANLIEQVAYFEYLSPAGGSRYQSGFQSASSLLSDSVNRALDQFFESLHPNTLLRPAMYGDLATLLTRLDGGAPVDDVSHDKRGASALMYAVLYEQEDCVRSLLEHGADVNLLDAFLSTPIMLAVCTKNRSIVTLLQEAGADLDQKNKAGESVREQAERVGLEL